MRARLQLTLLVSIAGVLGCRPAPSDASNHPAPEPASAEVDPPPAAEPEPLRSHVRIPRGARLYMAPRADARSVLYNPAVLASSIAEVGRSEGEFVEITLGDMRGGGDNQEGDWCGWPISFDPTRASLWVRRRELGSVVAERVEIELANDTSATLLPGVGLYRTAIQDPRGTVYEIDADGLSFRAPVPEQAVGLSFERAPALLYGDSTGVVTSFDVRLDDDQPVVGTVELFESVNDPVGLFDYAAPGTAQVVLRSRCVELRVHPSDDEPEHRRRVRPPDPHNPTYDPGGRAEAVELPPGIELSWVDGTPAGSTTGAWRVQGWPRDDGRFCFGLLDSETNPALAMCVAESALPAFASVATLRSFELSGARDPALVEARLRELVPDLLHCMKPHLERGASSDITMRNTTLDADGRMPEPFVGLPIPSGELGDCVENELTSWDFGPAKGPSKIDMSVTFDLP